jgi:hypothetical protein
MYIASTGCQELVVYDIPSCSVWFAFSFMATIFNLCLVIILEITDCPWKNIEFGDYIPTLSRVCP